MHRFLGRRGHKEAQRTQRKAVIFFNQRMRQGGIPYFLLISFFVNLNCGPPKSASDIGVKNALSARDLSPYGRTYISKADELGLISSAAHFGFSFEGKECQVYASVPNWLDHNYLQYEIDGVYQKRIRINKGDRKPIVLAADKEGKHTVWIYKATEAHTGDILIGGISGKNLQAIKPSDAPLIEFIGNSITCGAAADPSEIPCGTGVYHDQHNAYHGLWSKSGKSIEHQFYSKQCKWNRHLSQLEQRWSSNAPGV